MIYQIIVYPIEFIIEFIYAFFQQFLGNPALSIVGVSLGVNILSLPLYNIAEKWQQIERDTQIALKPKVDKIKSVFSGDEQYMILSTYYKQNHYHPIYALRSSVSLIIQVPFFIAAYHFLSNLESLQNASFFIFNNLGRPDQLFKIGSFAINLLPLVMTAINIIAGAIYTKGFPLKEKVQLYAMAALFLVLLYNSPSGLVIYWTLNNIFSLIKNLYNKSKNPGKLFYFTCVFALFAASLFVFFFTDKTFLKKLVLLSATILVVLIPLYIKIFNYLINKPLAILEKNKKMRLSIFITSCIGLFLLTGVVIPLSLFSSSPQEFSFIDSFTSPLQLLQFPLLQSFGLFIVWCIALYALFSSKTKSFLAFLMPLVFVIALLNTFIFTGNYGNITNVLEFSTGMSKKPELVSLITDFLVIFGLLVTSLLLFRFIKKDLFTPLLQILCLCLFVFSVINTVQIQKAFSLYNNTRVENTNSTKNKNVFTFSTTGTNVLFIMLDRAINSFAPYIFEEKPEVASEFDGFIYYPNTLSLNGHTLLATPPLFGGYDFLPEKLNTDTSTPIVEKHNKALTLLPKAFSNEQYKVTVTDAPWANYSWIPDNRIFADIPNVTAENLEGSVTRQWCVENNVYIVPQSELLQRNLLYFSFFRLCPSSFRGALYDDGKWWTTKKINTEISDSIKSYAVLDYLPDFSSASNQEPTYISFTNNLTHDSQFLQYPSYKPATSVTEIGENKFENEYMFKTYHTNMAAYIKLAEWFRWMKDNNVYDNTRIVIASDHGSDLNDTLFDFCNSLLLVKPENNRGAIKTDHTFMVTADVPSILTENLLDISLAPSTKDTGYVVYKNGRITPDDHKKNTFILDDTKWLVKENVFNAENWSKIDE
jgi:YidC/Oxa1 family membrane protein insertase